MKFRSTPCDSQENMVHERYTKCFEDRHLSLLPFSLFYFYFSSFSALKMPTLLSFI